MNIVLYLVLALCSIALLSWLGARWLQAARRKAEASRPVPNLYAEPAYTRRPPTAYGDPRSPEARARVDQQLAILAGRQGKIVSPPRPASSPNTRAASGTFDPYGGMGALHPAHPLNMAAQADSTPIHRASTCSGSSSYDSGGYSSSDSSSSSSSDSGSSSSGGCD
jgi:uncharacterized membrane protein YgcG